MKKHLIKIISLLCVIALLSGCSLFNFDIASLTNQEPDVEGENPDKPIRLIHAVDDLFSLNVDLDQPLNPLSTESASNLMFAPLIYEALFVLDENFEATPSRLLKSYSTEDGGITWRFYINDDIVKHDGSLLTASDVAYSINRAIQSKLYKGRLADIFGVTPYDSSGMVLITISRPNLSFYKRLDIPIIPENSLGEDIPAGTGPYIPNEQKTKLTIFSEHPDAADLPTDTIYLKSFASAEDKIRGFEDSSLDLVVNNPNGLSNLGYGSASVVKYFHTANMHYLGFNTKRDFFMYPGLRCAMSFIINRDYIVTNLMGGAAVAASLPMSPVSRYYNSTYADHYGYSPESCLTALKNAGVDDFLDEGRLRQMLYGSPLEISLDFIVCGESAVKVSAARAITESLESIGITVNLRELAWNDYMNALNAGEFDIYYGEVRLTADFDLTQLVTKDGNLNYGKYDDQACADRIASYLGADDETRQMHAELMCQYIVESAPIIPIAFEKQEAIFHRGVITGLTPTQQNIFYKFTSWKIDMSAQG